MKRRLVFLSLGFLSLALMAHQVAVARTTIPVSPSFYPTVEEAARAIQKLLGELWITRMLPSDTGSYEPAHLPVQAFAIGPKTLTLRYQVTKTQKEETMTIPLDRIRLSNGILSPDAKDPFWTFWITMPRGTPFWGPNNLSTVSREKAEILYNALFSLMAAAGNPHVPGEKIPATLSFDKLAQASAPKPKGPKLGFSVLPEAAPGEKGLKIVAVEQGSLAEKAGLVVGDVILNVNGQEVNQTQQLAAALKQQENLFTIKRGEQTLKMKIVTPVSF